ncbi:9574_t:CDS:2 [Acaulospora colombiana]|uniref:9574_t:CDS:1 n=1 Tax=Acaulospora colombiana TaxID=27376 RepID=A0ACA9K425_9GLOM|nr:9574_t:CDS:2 [Acaulospora colombiana]
MGMKKFACFFYGSLMFPKVLLRVLEGGRQKDDGPIVVEEGIPATLKGYKRLRVLGASYPALIKDNDSETQGILIKGLTSGNVSTLDHYEGDQYTRINVEVFPNNSRDRGQSEDLISAQTYLWISSSDFLEDQDWDKEEFEKQLENYLREEGLKD